jgi:hypothetical protein
MLVITLGITTEAEGSSAEIIQVLGSQHVDTKEVTKL